MSTTATIILAAGAGRRLGGRSKALLRLPEGEMLGIRAVRCALAAETVPVLVLGYEAEDTERTLREAGPELMEQTLVLHAEDWEVGLSASFRAGVGAARDAGLSRCAVLLVDQPGIGEQALAAVLAEHEPGRITRGAVEFRPSHPVVLEMPDALAAAETAAGDEGARAYLREHAVRVDPVDITDLAEDADLDTPEDLARWERISCPRARAVSSASWSRGSAPPQSPAR